MIPEQDEPITFAARPGCADDFEEPPINQFIDVGSCVVGVDAELVAQVLGGDDAHLLCQDQRDLLITIDAVGDPARVIFQPLVSFGVEQPKTVNCHGKSPDLCLELRMRHAPAGEDCDHAANSGSLAFDDRATFLVDGPHHQRLKRRIPGFGNSFVEVVDRAPTPQSTGIRDLDAVRVHVDGDLGSSPHFAVVPVDDGVGDGFAKYDHRDLGFTDDAGAGFH